MLRREGVIDEALIKKLLGWRHSGFSIHHQVRIGRQDQPGREKLAEYILRAGDKNFLLGWAAPVP